MKNITAGLFFAMLWASASAATKIGLAHGQPFVLANIRFIIAGFVLLIIAKLYKQPLAIDRQHFKQLVIYGFLNVTLYLGAFVLAIKHVSAGIGSLSTATNPLFITILSALFLGKKSSWLHWLALGMGMAGVVLATYPLLLQSYADPIGLIILFISMLSYSLGTVYYAAQQWQIGRWAINGWQVLLGGLMLLPLTIFYFEPAANQYSTPFWLSILWLIVPVSIMAVQLWLYLLSVDPVKASVWLFLCPIFGFLYAFFLLNEPLSWHTGVGTFLVLMALYLGRKAK